MLVTLKLLTPLMIVVDLLFLLEQNLLAFSVTSIFLLIYIYINNVGKVRTLHRFIYVFVYFLNVFAFMFDFYRIEWFDNIAHTLTPFALVIFIGPFLFREILNKQSISFFTKLTVLTSLGVVIGVFWEVWEYYANFAVFEQLAPTLPDTITDLIFDTIGSVLAAVIIITNE